MTKLPRHLIAQVVAQRSLENVPTRRLAREIAAYILLNRRSAELESLLRDIQQVRADRGIVEVTAISAHQLNDSIRRNIKTDIKQLYPAAKQIIIDEQLDETAIGGVRLELANQQFDASLRTKLNHFKQLAVGKG